MLSLEVSEIPEKPELIEKDEKDSEGPHGELEMTGQLGNVMKESV